VHGRYLGDSYDLVKRVLCQALCPVGPLYAHPRFIPAGIQVQYTTVTSIPILNLHAPPNGAYGLFLDPHTGIPLPDKSVTKATASHAPLPFIIEVICSLRPAYVVCFDQSYHRRPEFTVAQQRACKQAFLRDHGISSFYYLSHAPFLFMAETQTGLVAVRQRLLDFGIPLERLGTQV